MQRAFPGRVFVLIFIILGIGVGFAYLIHSKNIRHAKAQAEQAKRDASYNAILTSLRKDLLPGSRRAQVETYLRAQGIAYYSANDYGTEYLVNVGEDPGDNIACDRWLVQIAFEFSPSEQLTGSDNVLSPSDRLQKISLKKTGHCL